MYGIIDCYSATERIYMTHAIGTGWRMRLR